MSDTTTPPPFHPHEAPAIVKEIGKERLIDALRQMVLIRTFEMRAEASYLEGKIGGFFHSYIGQEAIQTSLMQVTGPKNWFITSYRCHALALLLGATPREIMAELFGKSTGNAKGRGGSMHLYTDRLLGGFGIVGGQIPIATGAALSCSYLEKKDEIALCFFGDGAIPQGAFHESLNMASLWHLPCMYIIENNQWSMGTHMSRGVANYLHISRHMADAYDIEHFRLDGMDYFSCYNGFKKAHQYILKNQRPVLIECVAERFKGHSVSDPGLYRSKDTLKASMQRDPILLLKATLIDGGMLTEDAYKAMEKEIRETVLDSIRFADESPWPNSSELEEGVFAGTST